MDVCRLQAFKNDEVNVRTSPYPLNKILTDSQTFLKMYAGIIEEFALSFELIFRFLIDYPDVPCLFHCTAGKDRTGIFVAILLLVCFHPFCAQSSL